MQKHQEMHRTRIKNIQATTDTSAPKTMHLDHLRNNLKREQMLEERYSQIDRENMNLLQKMSDIMKHPTFSVPRSVSGPVSLNRDHRKKELLRVTHENQAILKRIQRAQPVYNHIAWEEGFRRHTNYLSNCGEYPVPNRKRSLSTGATGGLTPLEPLDHEGSQARLEKAMAEDRERLHEQPAVDDAATDEMRYVLKEGKKIGEGYYLVEMATDGRTLTISAYDGDSQKTLELLVNEKNHRKLYRDTNGDYSAIAQRLRVEGDRLILGGGTGPQQQYDGSLQQGALDADDMVRAGFEAQEA
jgi:E3 ubiquitin-protein ligase TRIP12